MTNKRIAEEQLTRTLHESRNDGPTRDLWSNHHISKQAFFGCKNMRAGIPLPEAMRLRVAET